LPDNTNGVKVVHRLSREAYESLEAKLQPLMVQSITTDLEVSFVLGQQSVLKMLRKGFVIG